MNHVGLIIAICLIVLSSFIFSFNVKANGQQRSQRVLLEMKGKGGKVPVNQRGEYLKQQRMMQQKAQMEQDKVEGVPVFKVFVRPKVGGLWIPCGDLAGDQRATALVNAWMSGFLEGTYKSQLDQGIARSIFNQEDTFVTGLIENYKPFKKFTKEDLEFGYKIDFPGLEEKMGEQKVMVIERGMEIGWQDKVKDVFGGLFGGGDKK